MISRFSKVCCLLLLCATALVSSFSIDLQQRTSSRPNLFPTIHAATIALVATPLIAIAEEVDDYEYGAVDAPIAIPIIGGILAIATALLPVLLRGGEEAFEEMKERDVDTFGKRNNLLDKK